MTPEQRFARWVRAAIVLFVVLFVYFVFADTYMPVTPQARVLREVTRVAPQVSGPVEAVAVTNNAAVKQGQLLFRIDPEPFRIAVDKARLAVDQARRENAQLDAALAEARANLAERRATADELAGEQQRVESLIARGSISRQRYDSVMADARAARSAVAAAEARVHSLEVQRGRQGDDNLRVRQARNALAAATLDLRRTRVTAAHDGRVSNLQLDPGDTVHAGSPVLVNIGRKLDIIADFREKSLRHVKPGDSAWIALDARPGAVYRARVVSIDAGVRDGQLAADGNLASIPATDRWVRDAQRIRVHLRLDAPLESLPPTGARATVQLAPLDSGLSRALARAQITLLSLLHHVY
ncbi:MAG: secretion protein HlyD [Halomonadaceae bacterium T82-2]|nr:MAG: secretion protein HlyD [Halomonadaceae bacterium T82-2]